MMTAAASASTTGVSATTILARACFASKVRASLACCACMAVCALAAGVASLVLLDTLSAVGYFTLAGVAVAFGFTLRAFFRLQSMHAIARDLRCENAILQDANLRYAALNRDLDEQNACQREENERFRGTVDRLERDIDLITRSIDMVGRNATDLVAALKDVHAQLARENRIHAKLNQQQAVFQLLQMFRHFDADADFYLSADEIAASELFLKQVFPTFDTALLTSAAGTPVSFPELAAKIGLLGAGGRQPSAAAAATSGATLVADWI